MGRAKLILLGMFIAFAIMILTGANGADGPGRYQIAGAGGSIFYILDTQTGIITAAGGVGEPDGQLRATDAVQDATYYGNNDERN